MRDFLQRLAIFGLFIVLALELFFTFVMPASTRPRSVQNPDTGLVSFDTTWIREGTISHGPLCKAPSHWRINAAGMNSIFEYRPADERDRPLIAIVGDSFVEGFLSNVEDHVDSQLQELLGGNVEVYAFGYSGAQMAQYVAICKEVERVYKPDVYVFILHGDIDHALKDRVPQYFSFADTDAGLRLAFPRAIYRQNRIGRYFFRSALARYCYLNNHLIPPQNPMAIPQSRGPFHNAVPADLSPYLRVGRLATAMLDSIAPGKPKVFVCDGPPASIYAGEKNIERDIDYHVLQLICAERPTDWLLDLMPTFLNRYQKDGRRFSPDFDPHWNRYGNGVVAGAIKDFITKRNLLSQRPS